MTNIELPNNITVQTLESVDANGNQRTQRLIRDEALHVTAYDNMYGPYVDLYNDGASAPFDTVNVWQYGEGKRQDDDTVTSTVIDRLTDLWRD